MTLEEYLRERLTVPPGREIESPWLDVMEFALSSGEFLVVDPVFLPNESDGVVVKAPRGCYLVQTKVVTIGGDFEVERKILRCRAILKEHAEVSPGAQIGETWTDCAKTAICDLAAISEAWDKSEPSSQKIHRAIKSNDLYGTIEISPAGGAGVLFFSSGFGDGSYPVTELLFEGNRVGFDVEFIEITKDEPEEEDAESQYRRGQSYAAGRGVARDYAEALRQYERAAQQNHAGAIHCIAAHHESGAGVPVDFIKARSYFERAANLGYAKAVTELGICYAQGRGGPQDESRAIELFDRAAAQGERKAELLLGARYLSGKGVPLNVERAIPLIKSAATKEYAPACFLMGLCYQKGVGVPKNDESAFQYFAQGAAKEHKDSVNSLANCYRDGCGTEKDLIRAELLYRKAASEGHVEAAKNLAGLESLGNQSDL